MKSLNYISSVKLTRKEFLLYLGTLALGVLGISSFFKLIANSYPNKKDVSTRSFGKGAYGV
jgi:hypothetical protein